MEETPKKRRQYTVTDLQYAIKLVQEEHKTVYAASKQSGVPWSTLNDYLKREDQTALKLGRPFALSSEMELKLYNYVIQMQEMGFGLSVHQLRVLAYKAATSENREKYLSKKEIASMWWWTSFKKRYGLTLRVAENLSAYRASMANPVMIADFYSKFENLVMKLGIKDCADRIWNCDETGLNFVTSKGRVIASIGKRYIYNRTYAERGENHTMLGCICADGTWIPPLVIFKGVRWSDNLKTDAMPNSMVKLSKKGWITSEIFLEWFRFFINAIPDKRPVVLLMDSHSSHITPEVIDLAKENSIYLMTFPAHNTHILQPLDVGVYKSLKHHWSECVKKFMRENPTKKPDRTDFHGILNPAYFAAFSSRNIVNSFKKCGICPLDKTAVDPKALAPSQLTEKEPEPNVEPVPDSPNLPEQIFVVPKPSVKKKTRKRTSDSSARCLNENQPSTLCQQPRNRAQRDMADEDDDWICVICNIRFSEDAKKKNGKKWVQCSYCIQPYHNDCLNITPDEDEAFFRCEECLNYLS